MFILKWLLILILVLAVGLVAAGQFGLLRGTPPTDLGVHDGRLKGPSNTPNSVTSQAGLHPGHPMRVTAEIAPLALRGDGPATMAKLKAVVEGIDGAVVVKTEPDYLYAQFTTRWMKYTDDVEFWFDPTAGVVQVRSASRIGRGDLGANRQRVEAIRVLLAGR
jgi:uncharacterized protein (DUF1499 family)